MVSKIEFLIGALALLQVNRANETIQCENCDRILEERYNDSRVTAVNVERESPYCVIPNDALAQHKFEGKLEGDPFHASGERLTIKTQLVSPSFLKLKFLVCLVSLTSTTCFSSASAAVL